MHQQAPRPARNADEGTRRMHSIAASSPANTATSLPTPPTGSTNATAPTGGDLLAAMNPAMDAAFAVGRPTDSGGAAAILATTGAYVAGAQATIGNLDEGIRRREHELEQLRLSDPDAAAKKSQDLDMLRALRDRIQLSIERVTRTAAGGDDDAAKVDGLDDAAATKARRRREEDDELLEQRRRLLAPTSIDVAPGAHQVARAYASTSTSPTTNATA